MKTNNKIHNMFDHPANVIHLQQLMKTDPDGYKFELCTQYSRFCIELDVLNTNPSAPNKSLADLVLFLGQVSHLYKSDLEKFPQQIIDTLKSHAVILDPDVRLALCRALVLLRNRNIIPPLELLNLFFGLLHCRSKLLRAFLQSHIISDIKNLNSRHKNNTLNTALQNFLFGQMGDTGNAVAMKMSLDIMIELYRKNVWHDAKTVNVIALACFSKITKVLVAAVQFFLGADEEEKEESDSEGDDTPQVKDVAMANKVNKKSKKRKWILEKAKKQIKKNKKKNKAPTFNFSAIHLIYNPQDMAEKLLKMVSMINERYEVKLMIMELISRLVGIHQLFLFNFFSFLIKYLQPHQSQVTKILLFAAQASHELILPEVIGPVVQTIAHNFVTDRNSGEVMAVGLNAIREICARCPLAISEDLLQDLVQYKSHRDKNVNMAARSLMLLYRNINPQLLNRKDRGKPTQATQELKPLVYGDVKTSSYVSGAEVLAEEELTKEEESEKNKAQSHSKFKTDKKSLNKSNSGSKQNKEDNISDSDEESDSSFDDLEEDEEEFEDEEGEDNSEENEELESSDESNDGGANNDQDKAEKSPPASDKKSLSSKHKTQDFVLRDDDLEAKRAKATELTYTKIFTQEDFRKIKAAEIAKHVHGALPKKLKRKNEQMEPPPVEDASDEEEEERGILPSIHDIERVHKRRKMDKESRLATAMAQKESKEKYAGKWRDGKNNKVKSKNKPFMMIKHKAKRKAKRSFRERQMVQPSIQGVIGPVNLQKVLISHPQQHLALKRSLIKNQKAKYK